MIVSENKRIPEVDILRGLAGILVVLGHSFITHPISIIDIQWCNITHYIVFSFHMALFFFLAGFVYRCENYGEFIKKKTMRILIPYLFFSVVSLLLHVFGGELVNGSSSITDGIFAIILNGGDYWFLYTIFIIYLVYPWFDMILPKNWMKAILAVGLGILATTVKMPSILTLGSICYYFPFFIVGHLVHKCTNRNPNSKLGAGGVWSTFRNGELLYS